PAPPDPGRASGTVSRRAAGDRSDRPAQYGGVPGILSQQRAQPTETAMDRGAKAAGAPRKRRGITDRSQENLQAKEGRQKEGRKDDDRPFVKTGKRAGTTKTIPSKGRVSCTNAAVLH